MTDVQNSMALIPGQRVESPLAPGITFEVVNLTPELAEEFLTHLPQRQRSLSPATVDMYSADMLEGEWIFTGDAIRFDTDGNLIDGQHRCTAVVESGRTVPAVVIRGLNEDAILNLDNGRRRSFGDDLRIKGYPNHTALAALVGRVWHWEHGNFAYKGVPMVRNAVYANTSPTRAQLWATLAEHPELVEITTHGQRVMRYLPNITISVIAFSWWLLGEADVDRREKFFHELVQGSSVNSPEYPITVLKRVATRRMGPSERLEGWVWLAYVIKAWNAWYNEQSISYLRMPTPARWDTLPRPMGLDFSQDS